MYEEKHSFDKLPKSNNSVRNKALQDTLNIFLVPDLTNIVMTYSNYSINDVIHMLENSGNEHKHKGETKALPLDKQLAEIFRYAKIHIFPSLFYMSKGYDFVSPTMSIYLDEFRLPLLAVLLFDYRTGHRSFPLIEFLKLCITHGANLTSVRTKGHVTNIMQLLACFRDISIFKLALDTNKASITVDDAEDMLITLFASDNAAALKRLSLLLSCVNTDVISSAYNNCKNELMQNVYDGLNTFGFIKSKLSNVLPSFPVLEKEYGSDVISYKSDMKTMIEGVLTQFENPEAKGVADQPDIVAAVIKNMRCCRSLRLHFRGQDNFWLVSKVVMFVIAFAIAGIMYGNFKGDFSTATGFGALIGLLAFAGYEGGRAFYTWCRDRNNPDRVSFLADPRDGVGNGYMALNQADDGGPNDEKGLGLN